MTTMAEIAHLKDAFSGISELKARPVVEQEKRKAKRRVGHFVIQKCQNFGFCPCPRKNKIKCGAKSPLPSSASKRKGMLSPHK